MLTCYAIAMTCLTAAPPAEADAQPFRSVFRHHHYFLVWNDQGKSPRMTLDCVGFHTYPDPLRYKVIDAASRVLVDDQVGRDGSQRVTGLPGSKLYLVYANPKLNGVRFAVDRPYGIVADSQHRLGLNAPRGRLHLYVPSGCKRFRVVVQCNSPREGARVEVHDPTGKLAAQVDGELDQPAAMDVAVPAGARGKAWSLVFMKPRAKGVSLDDVNVHLEGDLLCFVTPRRAWAETLVPKLPRKK